MSDFPPNCVAFVTGAASGIGLAVAQRLVADGVKNIAIVDITHERLLPAVSSLAAIDPSATVLQIGADCSQEAEVEAAVSKTVETFGRLDVCFNAAGMSGDIKPMAEQSSSNLDNVLGLNLKGVWYCQRAQIKQMLKQEMRDVTTGLKLQTRGSIINVGSLTSHLAINNINPYIISKHGVLGLTRADAMDYAEKGIRINCICPGWITTGMTQHMWKDGVMIFGDVAGRAPMKRWGLPEEVAYTVSFLASDRASFVTGTAIDIDGGLAAAAS